MLSAHFNIWIDQICSNLFYHMNGFFQHTKVLPHQLVYLKIDMSILIFITYSRLFRRFCCYTCDIIRYNPFIKIFVTVHFYQADFFHSINTITYFLAKIYFSLFSLHYQEYFFQSIITCFLIFKLT